jgi:hypothetical protein
MRGMVFGMLVRAGWGGSKSAQNARLWALWGEPHVVYPYPYPLPCAQPELEPEPEPASWPHPQPHP